MAAQSLCVLPPPPPAGCCDPPAPPPAAPLTPVNPPGQVAIAYRIGDFQQALTGKNVCPAGNLNCDPLGRPIMENAIYDPRTTRTVGG